MLLTASTPNKSRNNSKNIKIECLKFLFIFTEKKTEKLAGMKKVQVRGREEGIFTEMENFDETGWNVLKNS